MKKSAKTIIPLITLVVVIVAVGAIFNGVPIQNAELAEKFESAQAIEESAPHEALDIYSALIDEGHTEAKVRFAALMLLDEISAEEQTRSSDYAVQLLHEAVEEGSVNALYKLGLIHEAGLAVSEDADRAREFYRKAAEQSHSGAMFRLGYLYKFSDGAEADVDQAIYWFSEAAKLDNVDALFLLAQGYRWGWGSLPVDIDKTIELLERGVALGHSRAMVALGSLIYDDEFGHKDEVRSFELFKEAALLGNVSGQGNLAESYLLGVGTEVSYEDAAYWYKKAAETGSPIARFQLAVMYREGRGVKQDEAKARELFQGLADEGNVDAARALNTQ